MKRFLLIILTFALAAPTLASASVCYPINGCTGTSTWQTGSIPFFNGTTFTENNPNLFWNNAFFRLGVGTSSPWATLSASSTSAAPTFAVQQNSTGPAAIFMGGTVGIGTIAPTAQLNVGGTYTTANAQSVLVNPTLASSVTGTQYGILDAPTFTPTGASVGTMIGFNSAPRMGSGAIGNSNFQGINSLLTLNSGFTNTIVNGYDYVASTPTLNGNTPMTTFTQYLASPITNGDGTTTGTINNYGFFAGNTTASSSAGGTVSNRAFYGTVPSGSPNGGTTNNYGLYLSGNGGTSNGGTVTNYAIYNASTANNYFAGNIGIGVVPTSLLQLGGTDITSAANMFQTVGTLESSQSVVQEGTYLNTTFSPTSNVTQIDGLAVTVPITGASTITSLIGIGAGLTENAGYTGAVPTTANTFVVTNPSISGGVPFPAFRGYAVSAISNGNATTTGTINNAGVFINAITAASGGATVNNYDAEFITPTGNATAGTNNNYALYLDGNGPGASAGGTNNTFALYDDSTANNYFAGNVGIGSSTPAFPFTVSNTNGNTAWIENTGGSRADLIINNTQGVQQSLLQFDAAGTAAFQIGKQTNGDLFVFDDLDNRQILYYSTSTQAWDFDQAGNVGISTSTPGTIFSVQNALNVTIGTSTFYGGLQMTDINETGTATSTFKNGISISSGCYAINGTCTSGGGGSGTVTNIATTYPVLGGPITTSGTVSLAFGTTTANMWSLLQTFSAASTTNFTAGSSNLFSVFSTGEVSGFDKQTSVSGQISPMRYISFKLGTSTAWTATSSASSVYSDAAQIIMPFAGTVRTLSCATNAGTLEIEASVNSTNDYYPASSTAGTYIYSNAFTVGQQMTVIGGNPASSPVLIPCTMGITQTI